MTNQPYTVRLAQWLFAQDWYDAEYQLALRELFPEGIPKLNVEDQEKFEIFVNLWITYDRPTSIHDKKPIEFFIETVRDRADLAIFRQFSQGWFGAFEIETIQTMEGLTLRDLVTDQVYEVSEQKGTVGPEIGDVLFARIMPFGKTYILAAGFGVITGSAAHSLVYTFSRLRASGRPGPLQAPDLAHLLFGHAIPLKTTKWEAILNLDMFLKEHGYIARSAAEIADDFKNLENFNPVIAKMGKALKLNSKKDIERLTVLLAHLWNVFKARAMKRPEAEPGPIEVALIEDMLHTIQQKQQDVKLKNEDEARRFGEQMKEEYLHTSQSELDGQTPWQAIMAERRSHGNSDETFHYEMTVHAFDSPLHEVEKLLRKALKATERQRYNRALHWYEKIIALGEDQVPEIWRIYGNAAVCAFNLGDLEGAEMYLKKSLALNPSYELAKKHMADLKAFKKRHKKYQGGDGVSRF